MCVMVLVANRHERAGLLETARAYIEQVLQAPLLIEGPVATSSLPSFLGQRYALVGAEIFGRECVLMIPNGDLDETPATVAKHREALQRHLTGRTAILVTDRLSNHNRARLISQRVPFIVPGNQLFIPELAMDLREHFRSDRAEPADSLTPTAQVIVLALLMDRINTETTPTELATQFRYSAMSMSRAISELEALELLDAETSGRYRNVRFPLSRAEVWARVQPLLRTPVRKRRRVRRPLVNFKWPRAGECALAERTDLSHPRLETYAIAAADWKAVARQHDLDRPAAWDETLIELETWTYDPLLLGDADLVDPISLWLSLPNTTDDRIGAAKDALLKEVGL
jgi:DNA-binding MarR family transcriptional regulator